MQWISSNECNKNLYRKYETRFVLRNNYCYKSSKDVKFRDNQKLTFQANDLTGVDYKNPFKGWRLYVDVNCKFIIFILYHFTKLSEKIPFK